MTLAPQSANWRTQVGPERTRVRSSTVKRERAFEARGNGIRQLQIIHATPRDSALTTFPDLGRNVYGRRHGRGMMRPQACRSGTIAASFSMTRLEHPGAPYYHL